jgi:hypothetical protein
MPVRFGIHLGWLRFGIDLRLGSLGPVPNNGIFASEGSRLITHFSKPKLQSFGVITSAW